MSRLTTNRIRSELNNFAQRVLRASPVAMILMNKQGVMMKANPAAESLFNYRDNELVGFSVHKLEKISGEQTIAKRFVEIEDEAALVNEANYQRKDGTTFTALRAISALPETSGEVHYYLETVVDITELKRMQDELRELAEKDKLTDLLNRRSGDIALEQALHDAEINNEKCSAIMGDIDHFKRVNDTYGHLAGDRILANVARQVKLAVRSGDYCIRWGGEEFLIVLPRCSKLVASTLAERIRSEIANLNDDEVGRVTMSFGVSEWIQSEKPVSFIHRVDLALFKAKSGGRNRVEVA